MGNLLRSLKRDSPRQWDIILPQAKFAYNQSIYRTIGKSPFEIIYGRNLITPLDLTPLTIIDHFCVEGDEQLSQIKEHHQQVRMQIEKHNKHYVDQANKHKKRIVYRECDLVDTFTEPEASEQVF